MSTRIFLIRHGTTGANLNNIFAGRSDEPLHPEGKLQLSRVAEKLRGTGVNHIYCGPLTRTRMSAEIISKTTDAPLETHDAFNEIDIAHWDGLTKDEIRERFGPEYPTWLETPEMFSVEYCETLTDVQTRAVKGTEEILAAHPGRNIVVVSHLIVLRTLVLHYRNLPLSAFRSLKIGNASITELVQRENGQLEVVSERE
ncbi:MAG: histidine phosphatase family protein [Proteobacteria bacterium]|nr:histidine phosphatase family protein [Pseudomonadota bacterium]MBU1737521.1 histidine phosphatase family protein [Pseudomonadota bacterium]